MVGGEADRQSPTATGNGADEHGEWLEIDGVEQKREIGAFPRWLGEVGAEAISQLQPAPDERGLVQVRVIQEATEPLEAAVQRLGRRGHGAGQIRQGEALPFQESANQLRKVPMLSLTPGGRDVLDKGENLGVWLHKRRLRW